MLSMGPKALPGCCRQHFTAVYFSVAVRYLPLPGGIFSAFFPADRPLEPPQIVQTAQKEPLGRNIQF